MLKRFIFAWCISWSFVGGVYVQEQWLTPLPPLASAPTHILVDRVTVDSEIWSKAVEIMERVDLRSPRERAAVDSPNSALREAGLL